MNAQITQYIQDKGFTPVHEHKGWSIAVDVGGTFTDAIARSPKGELRATKVLSSGTIKGIIHDVALDGLFIEDPMLKGETDNLYQDYQFKLFDHKGICLEKQTVAASSGENAVLTLEGPLKIPSKRLFEATRPGNIGQLRYELSSDEPAPIIAIRKLLGISRHQKLSGLDVRLGTTRGTNALLERKGHHVSLITTTGFKDTPKIGNQTRPNLFSLQINKPDLLHQQAIEIHERISHTGQIIQPLDLNLAKEQLIDLQKAYPDTALAICLINSYMNPVHEKQLAVLAQSLRFRQISVSHQISNTIGFLSRMDTTLVDAYLTPVIQAYIQEVATCLANKPFKPHAIDHEIELMPEPLQFTAPDNKAVQQSSAQDNAYISVNGQSDTAFNSIPSQLRFMSSAGSLLTTDAFSGKDCLLSGPAGGVTGMSHAAESAGFKHALGFDMGGTSTDVCRYSGQYEYQFETEKAGIRVATPMYAIETVAAGGGSICHFDGQRLLVGPESAGSTPGPACYGRGGPLTITDMNLICGRLSPDKFPFKLDQAAVMEKLDTILKHDPLKGLSPSQLAMGFLQIANQKMANAVSSISRAKGYDPRDHVLVSFGGAAGQHACAIANLLGIQEIIQHPLASMLSSYGISLADESLIQEKTILLKIPRLATDSACERLSHEMNELINAITTSWLHDAPQNCNWQYLLDFRYENESQPLTLQVAATSLDHATWVHGNLQSLIDQFENEHLKVYGHHYPDRSIELVNIRVMATKQGYAQSRQMPIADHEAATSISKDLRPSAFATAQLVLNHTSIQAQHYLDQDVKPGMSLKAPAIIFQSGASLVIEPGWQARKLANCSYQVSRTDTANTARQKVVNNNMEQPDPLSLELYNQRFSHIATQMGHVLQRTSVSVNIKDRLDFSCAILDQFGDLVVNAPHIPVHLGAMGATVRSLLKARDEGYLSIEKGDVFITNDPQLGGSHLPDVTLITPVFLDDGKMKDPAFFTASRAHHAEIGGIKPGSCHPFAKNLNEEGVIFQHDKVMSSGQFQENDLLKRLLSATYPSRNPQENIADIQAAIAANRHGALALNELILTQGKEEVFRYMRFIRQAAQEKTQLAIKRLEARLGRGPHVFEDYLDGAEHGIKVNISLNDGRMHLDFTGTSPIQKGSLNANEAIVRSSILYVLRLLIDEDIPLNEGVLAPISVNLPYGMLNPLDASQNLNDPESRPAVVGGNVELSQKIVDVLLAALNLSAASQGTMNNLIFGNEHFGYYETICGGTGGTHLGPGTDAVHSHMTNTRMTDVEILEAKYPVRLRAFRIRNAQPMNQLAVHAGGSGIERDIEFLEPVELSLLTQRRDRKPFGLKSGRRNDLLQGETGWQKIIHPDGRETLLPGMAQCQVNAHDRLLIATPSGGSYQSQ